MTKPDPNGLRDAVGSELGAEIEGVQRDVAMLLLEHFRLPFAGADSPGILFDDKTNQRAELAWAAICYAAPGEVAQRGEVQPWVDPWPWDSELDRRPTADADLDRRIDGAMEALAYLTREVLRLRRKRRALAMWLDRRHNTPVPAVMARAIPAPIRFPMGAQRRESATVPPESIPAVRPSPGDRIRWHSPAGVWELQLTGVCRDPDGAVMAVYAGPRRWLFDEGGSWPPPDVELVDP